MSAGVQDDLAVLRDAFAHVKSFRYNDMTLRGRGGLSLIQELLSPLHTVLRNWEMLQDHDRQSIAQCISEFVVEAFKILCLACFRNSQITQLACIKHAALCAFEMLKAGLVESFTTCFTYLFPIHDGKVHESLQFFQNFDSTIVDDQAQLIHVTVWEGSFVPTDVLSYMDSLMGQGLLLAIFRELERAGITSARGFDLVCLLARFRYILPHLALCRVKECFLRALNSVLSSDGQDLRKIDKNILQMLFRNVVLIEGQLQDLSVNELGHFCISLLKSPLLDKRIVGSQSLNLLCDHALSATESYDKHEEIVFSLRKVLNSSAILDLLFGPSMHAEVSKFKRCNNIVRIVFGAFDDDESNALSKEHAAFLWNSLFDRHSEMFDCCFEAYQCAIGFVSAEVLPDCVHMMLSTSDELLNTRPRSLNLFFDVLEKFHSVPKLMKNFVDSISEYLLRLQLDHSDNPAFLELVMCAKTILFNSALKDADGPVLFQRICEQCVRAVQDPAATSCKVLEFLLEFYSEYHVESCESELVAILRLVLDALCTRPGLDPCSVSMFAFLSHYATVKLIGPELEEKLWRALAVDSGDKGRQQQAFAFILHSHPLSMDVQRSILENRLPALPASCVSPKALECLLYLIKVVNTPESRIQIGKKRDRPESINFPAACNLIGLETLWKFCLSCPDTNILQRALSEFSIYIIEGSRVHPEIFKSVVAQCVLELSSVGSDIVRARNVISLMLDLSRSADLLLKDHVADTKLPPLGHVVEQPYVLVMTHSNSSVFIEGAYHSPFMTIKEFRAEIGSKLDKSLCFVVQFQVVNSEGQLDFVIVDDDSDILGRFGPVITCKLKLLNADQSSSMVAQQLVHHKSNSKPENRRLSTCHDSQCRVQPPAALCEAASLHVSGTSSPQLPLIRYPLDDCSDVTGLGNSNDDVSGKCSSRASKTAASLNSREFHDLKYSEGSQFCLWSMFTENSSNYDVLFELGCAFPILNARIWELLLLLPVNVEFLLKIRKSLSRPRMFFDLKSALEKMYFLSCASAWSKLPSCCFDQKIDSDQFYSSVAVAALDTTDALQSSVSVATSYLDPLLDLRGSFAPLYLSYHLSAICAFRRETRSEPNFSCLSYYLALLSASIIGLSHCDGADTHEKLIASVLQGFECNPILGHLHGYSAALATHAVSIIQSLSVHNDLLLQSFSQIPVPRRHSLIRLLLCSASCPNLLQPNASPLPNVICLFLQDFLRTLTLSFHQSSILLGFADFVSQDSSMLCPAVNFNWMTLFFKVFFMARDECTSLDSLFQASLCILSCIRKYMSFAKCNKNVYAFKLPSLFLLQSVILRLMTPMDFAMHPLAHEVSEHFRIIFEVASFPEDVTLTDASDDTKSNVLSPRPVTLVLKRPLCAIEDSVCVELSVMIQEAINRLPSLCNSMFETLLRNSESMLLVQKKSYQSSASLERKFVGIINLGCTCYFNSITQQLFMLPGFAASVIAARVKADAPEDLETARQLTADVSTTAQSKSNTAACGILDNFRDIMIYLRHGSGNIYPKIFCDFFRFPDGSCILPDVQQDALEYFHILCDHLDNALKGGHDEKLLSRFFGGRSATQLICKGCPHRYERFEHFFTLQLAVFSNRANSVLGALQEFVAGELLEGDNQYFCSQCNKKVDTVKRTVLADLPDSIILGLKRFDFNYDTMQRIKLNVEVPFSQDLDMAPFCRENLGETPIDSEPATKRDPGYYQYSLAGIVIHSGMADSGHYFSIIRDSEQTGLWHKFNDDTVTQLYDFDPKTFFGGQSSGKSVHANAYILVYNRKVPIFNHQYGQIASIENSVQLVKHTEKLSTHTMLVDSLKNRHLWQCFASSMHRLFLSSEDDRMETAYVDLLLKLNVCSALDTTETAAAFFFPLQASLSNPRKCYAILERFFARFEDAGTIDAELLQPFLDANSKRFPELPSFFTNAMKDIVSNAGACDISLFTADELLAYRNVIYGILKFYGNLSFRLYRFFPAENPADIEPITAQVAYAVQRCLHEALFRQGLEKIALRYFFFKSQLSDENVDSNENFLLLRTCLTSAVFSHLSEEAPKLRSKRRAHLKSFVFESRFLACLNCLKLLNIFFLDQDHVPVQQLLANGAWDPCFSALFTREFFVSFLYCGPSPQPVHKNIMAFFYQTMTRLLPQIPFLVNIMHENLHDFAQNTACFCLPVHMSFWTFDMATLVFNVFCCLGGDQLKLLGDLYSSVIMGYVANCESEEKPPHHTYRMMIVIVMVDLIQQQKNGDGCQTFVNYLATQPCPNFSNCRKLHRHLESATAMPFSDNGTEFSSSDSSATANYFPFVLNLLSATQSANTEVGPTLEE